MTLDLEEALRQTAEQVTAVPFDLRTLQAKARGRRHRKTAQIATSSLAVVAASGFALTQPWTAGAEGSSSIAAASTIQGVEHFTDLGRNHVEGPVTYLQDPPVGGNHNPQPQTCGVYTHPIPNTSAVHSLEHGAVWITYGPDVPAVNVKTLQNDAMPSDKVIVSPYPSLKDKISLQAWGLQLIVMDANDPRISDFIETYVNGPQTSEQGASCAGNDKTVNDPHDPTPQQ